MPLVPLRLPDEFSPVDRDALAAGESFYGRVLETWAAIGNSPGLFATYLPFVRRVAGPGSIDQRIKELAAVRVAVLNHCRYTASHRCTSALAAGIPVADLGDVARGAFDRFTERERVALTLADEMTLTPHTASPAGGMIEISPGLRTRVAELFGPAEVVELAMSISLWNALTRFHRLMCFELDMPEAPAEVAAYL